MPVKRCGPKRRATGTERILTHLSPRGRKLVAGVTRLVKQGVDFGHGHALGSGGHLSYLVARLYLPFLQHAEIEARPPVLDHQRGHLRLVHTDAQPVTGDTRLRHLE